MTVFFILDFKSRPVSVELNALIDEISQIPDRPDLIKRFCQKKHTPVRILNC